MAVLGRPTKYCDEIIQQARDYITDYAKHGHIIPSVVGMAVVLKVSKSTLYDWAGQEGNDFSDILDECMDHQEVKLFNGGLSGDFNASIAKLALGKHGYHDKQDTTLGGDVENPLTLLVSEIAGKTLEPKSE